MSKLNRDRYSKKLSRLLSRADDEEFFQLVWSTDALQSGRDAAAGQFLNYPPEAATSAMDSKHAVRKWELETLVGLLLTTPKAQIRKGANKRLNCGLFNSIAEAVNLLRKLENAEAGVFLKRSGVLPEMHRLAHRQFPWQRGYSRAPDFYRYGFIYAQGQCNDFFEESNGLSINEFSFIGFAMHASLQKTPFLISAYSLEKFGISRPTFEAGLKLLSTRISDGRRAATSLAKSTGRELSVAYRQSLLRSYPVVAFGKSNERLRSPLPQLIPLRTTAGLYYDLVPGGEGLLDEANSRFERYVREYVDSQMSRFEVSGSYKYGPKGVNYESPDVIVRDRGVIQIAIECKAGRLTFAAQYAEDPLTSAQSGYKQMARGVFQLWRYFSHLRRGIAGVVEFSPCVRGVVLTLDSWLAMAPELEQEVIANATVLADQDPDIKEEDRRAISFWSVANLEAVLSHTDEDSFVRVLDSLSEEQFSGWDPRSILEVLNLGDGESKPFPFPIGDVLPWWDSVTRGAVR